MRIYDALLILVCSAVVNGPSRLFAQEMNEDPNISLPTNPSPENAGPQSASTSPFAGFMDPFEYDARGRRDPFAQPFEDVPVEQGLAHGPLLPLQRFEVGQLRLVGIIWDVRRPKAMLLDPDGKTHVIGPNTKIGSKNGYVAVIREGEMVVVETLEQDGRLVSTAQVVKIAK